MFLPSAELTLRARVRARAFTLIELLVVISIIAVLMAILLPVVGAVQNSARKAQGKGDMMRLITATKMYSTEYAKYPTNARQDAAAAVNTDTVFGDPNGLYSNSELCNVLRALPVKDNEDAANPRNSRGVVYLTGNDAKNATDPRAGFVTKDVSRDGVALKKGALLDPWGSEYVVFIDADYADGINQSIGWFYYKQPVIVKVDIGAASLGKDGAWGTKDKSNPNGNGQLGGSDDVTTWQ